MTSLLANREPSLRSSTSPIRKDLRESGDRQYAISLFNSKRDNTPKPKLVSEAWLIERCEQPIVRSNKDGRAFSPATFAGKRANENVESISMLVLDYDVDTNWQADLDVWTRIGVRYVAYTTFSHLRATKDHSTPNERFRVVVFLKSPISKDQFPALWQWAYVQSGEKIDIAPKDASRLHYLPAKATAESPYDFYFNKGEPLDWTQLSLDYTSRRAIASVSRTNVPTFILREDADPPADKLDALIELDEGFRATYAKRRVRFQDDASRYDLSLASQSYKAGWTDQEIVDLLVSFRRRHNLTPKSQKSGDPTQYYADTLAKARSVGTDRFSDTHETSERAQPNDEISYLKEIRFLAEKLDLPLLAGVKQLGTANSCYVLELRDGRQITLGSAGELQQQSKVRAQLFDANALLPKHYGANEWNEILRSIRKVAEIVETDSEAEELHDYIKEYGEACFHGNVFIDFNDPDKYEVYQALRNNKSTGFIDIKDGSIFLPLSRFLERLNMTSGKRWSRRELTILLTKHGFRREQKSVRYRDKKGLSKIFNAGRFYVSPIGYVPRLSIED